MFIFLIALVLKCFNCFEICFYCMNLSVRVVRRKR